MLTSRSRYAKLLGAYSPGQSLLLGLLALLAAVPLAFVVFQINSHFGANPYFSTTLIAALLAVIMVAPTAAYLLVKRSEANPAVACLMILTTVVISLLAVYLFWVSFLVSFPADILIWAESAFVSDIIKFRAGYPIYSNPLNNESFLYTPGAPILTYLISSLFGIDFSIPFWRFIQFGFTVLAAVAAFFGVRTLLKMSCSSLSGRTLYPWPLLWMPVLLLIATNWLTNPFVANLHNDALGLLVLVVGYLLLLIYASTKRKEVLVLMALVPVAGFLIKQNTAIWAVLYVLYLAFFDQPRSLGRITLFAAGSFGLLIAALAVSYLIWGSDFFYWVVTVPAGVRVSPLRSFQHILDVWPYFAIGIIGGFALIRGQRFNILLGPWLVWLLLMLVEAYTSGNAYMVHHMGPGSLIAGVWFVAGLTKVWVADLPKIMPTELRHQWLGYGMITAVAIMLFSGLGLVRVPIAPYSDDYIRYVNEIDREFEGESAETILLDSGSSVYFGQSIVMKDRVTSIPDRANGQTGDYSGMIGRLESKVYSKILIRRLHASDLWYDSNKSPAPTKIREAILDNYVEIRVIKAVQGHEDSITNNTYLADYVSVLVPKTKGSRLP